MTQRVGVKKLRQPVLPAIPAISTGFFLKGALVFDVICIIIYFRVDVGFMILHIRATPELHHTY